MIYSKSSNTQRAIVEVFHDRLTKSVQEDGEEDGEGRGGRCVRDEYGVDLIRNGGNDCASW